MPAPLFPRMSPCFVHDQSEAIWQLVHARVSHGDLYAQEPLDDGERQEDDVERERQLEAREELEAEAEGLHTHGGACEQAMPCQSGGSPRSRTAIE